MQFQQAQGDLLFEEISQADFDRARKQGKPMKRDAKGRLVLAVSEVKGHTHAIYDSGVVAWMLDNGNIVMDAQHASPKAPVVAFGGTDAAHRQRMDSGPGTVPFPGEGHFPVVIDSPKYVSVIRQREFDPWAGWRQAAD